MKREIVWLTVFVCSYLILATIFNQLLLFFLDKSLRESIAIFLASILAFFISLYVDKRY